MSWGITVPPDTQLTKLQLWGSYGPSTGPPGNATTVLYSAVNTSYGGTIVTNVDNVCNSRWVLDDSSPVDITIVIILTLEYDYTATVTTYPYP